MKKKTKKELILMRMSSAWMTTVQIRSLVGGDHSGVNRSLNALAKEGAVERREDVGALRENKVRWRLKA